LTLIARAQLLLYQLSHDIRCERLKLLSNGFQKKMTPVGHSLVGATVGVVYCNIHQLPIHSRISVILGMILCANIPDYPLPGWGHDRYELSHSIFVGMLLVLGYVVFVRHLWHDRMHFGAWPFIAAGTLALYSHYLLDSFYNHGKGIASFWPFSEARLALPIPWFETMKISPPLCLHNVRVWSIELLCYGLLLVIAFQKGNGDRSS